MARIFVEVVRDAEPYQINESDFEVAFDMAPSLDSEKMVVAEEYWGGTQPGRDVKMFALDYYATSDFSQDLKDELLDALTNEMGDDIELLITVEPGLPSPNWAFRAMDTDYTMREAEADWLPKKKNPASTCPGCGNVISGAYEAGSYSCSGCGAGVQVNPTESFYMSHKGFTFHLEATAGTLRLWKSWGRMSGTQWAYTDTERPGFINISPDRGNLKQMKARKYKLPEGTPDRWTKVDEEKWLTERGLPRGHMKKNPTSNPLTATHAQWKRP